MRKNILLATCVAALALPLAACNDPNDTATVAQSYGPSPNLPPPEHSWIPTVDIASVNRWPDGAKPIAANGMTVTAFATGLEHPRTVYVLPNGDVLVAESNAPPKPDDGKGIKGFIYRQAQKWAGAGVPSANRITLLRDADGDGVAETRSIFLSGLNSPFGMVLVGEDFYVANSDAIMKFHYLDRRHQNQRARRQACGPARRPAQSPLDQGPHRQRRRHEALCNRRLQQQCRRKRHRGREGSRRGAGSRPRQRPMARVCVRPAQPERPGLESEHRRALGRRQRARRTRQRSGPRLHDLGEGRRVLWLAVQLLRRSRRHARPAATARPGAESHGSGLCARRAYGFAGARLQHRKTVSAGDGRRRLHRPAWFMESQAPRRLQGDLRSRSRTASLRARRRTC